MACQYALYSAPSSLCPPGQRVEIGLGSKLVRIYHRGRLLKLHPRQPRGGRSTDAADYPTELTAITLDRRLLDAVFSLEFLAKHEHVLLVGPAGVGKSFMAQALGFTAIRAGYTVRFVHSDDFFRAMAQARVDNSVDRTFRSFLAPDLLILDDLGLRRLTAQQSADLYELIINRHRASSFIITSNRAVEEWLSLFDDPILGNSALDRLANASYQIVIEGSSYRERLSPHRKLRGLEEVIDSPTAT